MAGIELTLLARNNEILGTATTDADGRATFTPGLMRGTGGMVPAVLTAKPGRQGLRLPRHDARRLRSLRPRRHRARRAGRARRLCLDRARHLPRRRDGPCRGARPRRARPRRSRTCRSPSSSRAPTASRTAASSATARGGRPCRRPAAGTQRHARHLDGVDLHRSQAAGGRQPDVPGRGLRAGPHRIRPDQPTGTRSRPAKPPTSPSMAASSMARRQPVLRSKAR